MKVIKYKGLVGGCFADSFVTCVGSSVSVIGRSTKWHLPRKFAWHYSCNSPTNKVDAWWEAWEISKVTAVHQTNNKKGARL